MVQGIFCVMFSRIPITIGLPDVSNAEIIHLNHLNSSSHSNSSG